MYQKPNAVETPRYEKPNAYDDETMVVTASRQGSRSSRMTTDSYSSRFFSQGTTPNTSPPSSPKPSFQTMTPSILGKVVTSSLLSQSSPTTQMSFHQLEEAVHPNATIRRKRSMIVDVLQYFVMENKEIFDCDRSLVYRKGSSRSWTSHQNTLSDAQSGQKLAYVRRKAFKDHLTVEPKGGQAEYLIKTSHNSVLFEYETFFQGSFMRWKRQSLLSNDFTCEIKVGSNQTVKKDDFIDSDSENEEDDNHDHHNHKTCRRWKLLLEYADDVECITLQRQVLNLVGGSRCDLLEHILLITSCTLIDIINKTF
ncbi:hypothetical protein BY458DRAFT_515708 [Sporodiniella umbellata]|nr:hypothetical protein BY458DRAFT_515708 [Sporodiniella umbellata]